MGAAAIIALIIELLPAGIRLTTTIVENVNRLLTMLEAAQGRDLTDEEVDELKRIRKAKLDMLDEASKPPAP